MRHEQGGTGDGLEGTRALPEHNWLRFLGMKVVRFLGGRKSSGDRNAGKREGRKERRKGEEFGRSSDGGREVKKPSMEEEAELCWLR